MSRESEINPYESPGKNVPKAPPAEKLWFPYFSVELPDREFNKLYGSKKGSVTFGMSLLLVMDHSPYSIPRVGDEIGVWLQRAQGETSIRVKAYVSKVSYDEVTVTREEQATDVEVVS